MFKLISFSQHFSFPKTLCDKALFSLREALKYCRLADDQQNLPYCLRDIGRVYLLTGEIDSTLFYYHRAIDVARMKKALSVESVICKELGVAYKTAGKYREAIEVVKRFSEMNTIIKNPSSCLSLGSLYLLLNNIDSAAYFLRYAQTATNPYTAAGANYYFYKLAIQTGDYKKAVYYNELYRSQKDSLDALADKDDLLELAHRYEQEELKNRLALAHARKDRNYLIFLFISITALGVMGIIYYRYRFRKEQEFAEQHCKLQNEKNKFTTIQKQFREQEAILLEKENQLFELKNERRILGDQFFSQTQYIHQAIY
ncbi:MAG: hypothetical protein PHG27_08045 [Massilibacteroides sp.]|nr:hypothetical protein [Massilibacteroides sp.]MDD3062527.1 hypothetical protein [Massilibacteroides sp.]MDD4115528.1 hypothetical protein [Massilibacteroides sp.]MDD4660327.1 hypothetical protein [Massilibacteroides sp.]